MIYVKFIIIVITFSEKKEQAFLLYHLLYTVMSKVVAPTHVQEPPDNNRYLYSQTTSSTTLISHDMYGEIKIFHLQIQFPQLLPSILHLCYFMNVPLLQYRFVSGTSARKLVINLSKTKRNLLYIRNQSVPRCKHFPPRL
jgi:hypothetical protein